MLNSYLALQPLNVTQLIAANAHALELPVLRNYGRQLMILDVADNIILHHEYPVYPGSAGLFNGNPNWQNKIFELIDHLFHQNKQPANIYFCGLRNEFQLIQKQVKKLVAEHQLPENILCHYIAPNLEEHRVKCQLSLARLEMNDLQDLIDDLN